MIYGNDSKMDIWLIWTSVQFNSVAQSCLTLCNPMDCSTPGFPVHHQLPESSQTHVHNVDDAIQPSHPLSSPSLPAFSLSQHQYIGPLHNAGGRIHPPKPGTHSWYELAFAVHNTAVSTTILRTHRMSHPPRCSRQPCFWSRNSSPRMENATVGLCPMESIGVST